MEELPDISWPECPTVPLSFTQIQVLRGLSAAGEAGHHYNVSGLVPALKPATRVPKANQHVNEQE